MRVTDHDVAVAEYIVDKTGVTELLAAAMRTSRRGRAQNVDHIRLMLIGLFLCIHHHRTAKLTMIHSLLTGGISVKARVHLGVAVEDDTVPEGHRNVLTLNNIKYVSRVFGKKLAITNVTGTERARREQVLAEVSDRVMDVFDLGFSSNMFALDATAIWSWGRGYRADPLTDSNVTDDDERQPTSEPEPPEDDDADAASTRPRRRHDPDARWGHKTAKNGGTELFFGYGAPPG